MLMPHSINHGNACFAYFNKIWGIPFGRLLSGEEKSGHAADIAG